METRTFPTHLKDTVKRFFKTVPGAAVWNLALALLMLTLARVAFLAWNWTLYNEYMDGTLLADIFRGGLRFDLSTLFYLNGLWMLLFLLPLYATKHRRWNMTVKTTYVLFNAVGLLANLADTVYVAYTGRRSTATLFAEFSHENNMSTIVGQGLLQSWPLVLLLIAGVWFMWKTYITPAAWDTRGNKKSLVRHCLACVVTLLAGVLCAVGSIRGGIDRTTRPITLSNANQYVNRPIEAAAVLNTPFSIIRTIGKNVFGDSDMMPLDQARTIYSYLHCPDNGNTVRPRASKPLNVVVLIVESFSRGYIGALNPRARERGWKGYTPFVDSLIDSAMTWQHSWANGAKSIDGMPSVLSSVPSMREPFFLTEASLNSLSSLPGYLKEKGYTSAFFHGAPNGSMGFEAFARHVGFDSYVGLDEYCASPRHNGRGDFDGAWAIWDEPFLQFMAEELEEMPQPFVAGVFTASSHHPFHVPDSLAAVYPEEEPHPLVKCIRYTDMALQHFFETASHMPWYDNTLFILTSDHSQVAVIDEMKTSQEQFASPIIMYAPGDSTLRGFETGIVAQQIDILPTVLNYLGYDKEYVAFGKDLFGTTAADSWAFDYNGGIYQLTYGDLFMLHDGEKATSLYRYRTDPMLRDNLMESLAGDPSLASQAATMEQFLRALVTQYCHAMNEDTLTPATYRANARQDGKATK